MNSFEIELTDENTKQGSGYLTLDGAGLPLAQSLRLSIADLSRIEFHPAANGAEETLRIRVFDGIDYSDPVTLKLKGDPFPVVQIDGLYTELVRFAAAAESVPRAARP